MFHAMKKSQQKQKKEKFDFNHPSKKSKWKENRKDSQTVISRYKPIELNKPLSYIFTMTKGDKNFPIFYKTRTPAETKKGRSYCAYHKVNGHGIDDCNALAKIVRNLIKAGFLREFAKKD